MDDYIVSEFVRLWWFENKRNKNILYEILEKYFYKDNINLESIINYLNSQTYNSFENKGLEFAIVQTIIGTLHDYQDITIFNDHIKYCVVPFMDIDFLYKLFSSTYSLFDNFQTSNNPFKKMKGGDLQCQIIKQMYPLLADLDFAQQYTPNDLLGNQLLYIIKRIRIKLLNKRKNYPGFPYENWFVEFIKSYRNKIPEELNEIFDINLMYTKLNEDQHKIKEGYWHKYSNIIMISYYLNNYKKLYESRDIKK